MKCVLDTNVVVSALLWGGTPYLLIEAAAAGDIELYTPPMLLTELREVLPREYLASRLSANLTPHMRAKEQLSSLPLSANAE